MKMEDRFGRLQRQRAEISRSQGKSLIIGLPLQQMLQEFFCSSSWVFCFRYITEKENEEEAAA